MCDEPFNLLLVEDLPEDARLIQEHIREGMPNASLDILHYLNEAEEQYRDYDAVLLDLTLPDTSGPHETLCSDLCIQISVPVIAITGQIDLDLCTTAAHRCLSGMLYKPTNAEDLRAAIMLAIARHRRLQGIAGNLLQLADRIGRVRHDLERSGKPDQDPPGNRGDSCGTEHLHSSTAVDGSEAQ